jgi:hypothetical protein
MPRGQNVVSFRKTTQPHDRELQSDIYLKPVCLNPRDIAFWKIESRTDFQKIT